MKRSVPRRDIHEGAVSCQEICSHFSSCFSSFCQRLSPLRQALSCPGFPAFLPFTPVVYVSSDCEHFYSRSFPGFRDGQETGRLTSDQWLPDFSAVLPAGQPVPPGILVEQQQLPAGLWTGPFFLFMRHKTVLAGRDFVIWSKILLYSLMIFPISTAAMILPSRIPASFPR